MRAGFPKILFAELRMRAKMATLRMLPLPKHTKTYQNCVFVSSILSVTLRMYTIQLECVQSTSVFIYIYIFAVNTHIYIYITIYIVNFHESWIALCVLFKRNLERKKQLQYNIQLQKCKNMMMLPRHPFPSHSPHHAYMHATVHLEPPQTWKKQPARNKESTKSYKNLLNQCSFKSNLVIWKRKSNQQKQSFTKATKMLQINTF